MFDLLFGSNKLDMVDVCMSYLAAMQHQDMRVVRASRSRNRLQRGRKRSAAKRNPRAFVGVR